jgi:lantibiotic modifying enzyme
MAVMARQEVLTDRWQPVLSGVMARRALHQVDSIAVSVTASITSASPSSDDERDPSLAGGHAGLALFYAWLASARRAPRADALAWRCLDEAVDAMSTRPMYGFLYEGFSGVAWATELVDRLLDPGGEDRHQEVDRALLHVLSRPSMWPAPHDLTTGAVGCGVYALERWPRPVAVRCLRQVVDRLHERARHDERGVYWWTTPEGMVRREDQQDFPGGRADLGVSHGLAGAVALLARLCAVGIEDTKVRPLLEGAVRWLWAQRVPGEAGHTFPYWLAPGTQPKLARTAWCYGDPGVAAALLLAARGAGDPGWEREAVALACRAAELPDDETGVEDASFCHGAAGLAHIYNRMYQVTGEPALGRAAVHWLERTLELCRLADGDGNAGTHGDGSPVEPPWWGTGLVHGAAGVALVLLAAATPIEPAWDRMFLLSGPEIPSRPSPAHD